jgi:hypothetical protein
MRNIPDIPSRKPKGQPALGGVSKPNRSQALRVAERDETWAVIAYFAGTNAWNG